LVYFLIAYFFAFGSLGTLLGWAYFVAIRINL
jgi:hypothetical protein